MVSKEEVKDLSISALVGASVVGFGISVIVVSQFWGDEIWNCIESHFLIY